MRIDAYTHFFPKKFFDKMKEIAGDYKDMGKRVRSLPALYDLDFRKKIVDGHKDYQQILSYPQPPFESFCKTPQQIDEMIRIMQRRLRRADAPRRRTTSRAGWRRLRSARPTPAPPRRSARSRTARSACRSTPTSLGKPIDLPEYLPFWKKMNELGKPIWIHPARGAETPDYPLHEKKSLYEIWWTLGWSYETACAMTRLVYSKIMDNLPEPQDHHPPLRRHRADARRPARPGQRRDGLAHHRTRTMSGCARASRSARSTTSSRTSGPTPRCSAACRRPSAGMEFFPLEKIVFASDCPFDPEGGTMYPRETLRSSTRSTSRRPTARRSTTRTWRRSPA